MVHFSYYDTGQVDLLPVPPRATQKEGVSQSTRECSMCLHHILLAMNNAKLFIPRQKEGVIYFDMVRSLAMPQIVAASAPK